MGEIADMMLDGTLCQGCGVYIESDNDAGVPRYCSRQCAVDSGAGPFGGKPSEGNARKVTCPTCKRRVKATGLDDHQRDSHGVGKSAP